VSKPDESIPQGHSNQYTLFFTFTLCAICAIILAAMASGLKSHQQDAIELDRSKQMLIAANVLDASGHFQLLDQGQWKKAILNGPGLIPSEQAPVASSDDITTFYNRRVHAVFTDASGKLLDPKALGIDSKTYFDEHQKYGFAHQQKKLFYVVLAEGAIDPLQGPYDGFIIPVNGFGLWGPIYGYLGLKQDAITVLGISWYQHGETPGLGANISEASWQKQFYGKTIFQKDSQGQIDPVNSPIGLVVLKGKVSEVYGNDPRADNSVDGMTGATITGNGVNSAYKDVLEQYRPFLIEAHKASRGQS
jgi:Na+-transporting NADH:ubiquinone oxidoreductase subunit C